MFNKETINHVVYVETKFEEELRSNVWTDEILESTEEAKGQENRKQDFNFIFWCRSFLKSLLNLLQCCFCACFMLWVFSHEACGILTPQSRDQTHTSCTGRQVYWTVRETPDKVWKFGLLWNKLFGKRMKTFSVLLQI